jgi:hypothetical protein
MMPLIQALILSAQLGPVYVLSSGYPGHLGACTNARVVESIDGLGKWCCDGTTWRRCGTPPDATYLVLSPNSSLPNATAISSLGAGLLVSNGLSMSVKSTQTPAPTSFPAVTPPPVSGPAPALPPPTYLPSPPPRAEPA